jgi:hypothetical protein
VSGGWLPQKAGGDGVDLDSSSPDHLLFLSPPPKPLERLRFAAVLAIDAPSNGHFFAYVAHCGESRRGMVHIKKRV